MGDVMRAAKEDLLESARRTVAEHDMIAAGDLVLVAVSGGPDSVALLSVLAELAPEIGFSIHVFHLNHRLRPESTRDAEFVRGLAEGMGLPVTLEEFDVGAYAREKGLGLETAAREARYRLMRKVAAEAGATKVATGHTLDDQAETFLMRLVRGAGTTGLRAIPPVRDSIIRPLLWATREQVLDWCREHGLSYRVDETNLLPDQIRNTIRLRVMPVLKELNPSVAGTIGDTVEILESEDEFMLAAASERFQENACMRPTGEISIGIAQVRSMELAIARRVLRQAVGALGEDVSSVGFHQVEEVLRQVRSRKEVEVHLTGDLWVWSEYEDLLVARAPQGPVEVDYPLAVPASVDIDELGLHLEAKTVERESIEAPSGEAGLAMLDAGALAGDLRVTTPRAGDRFRPFGMRGEKKLQDLFVDEKVPRRRRWNTAVVRDGKGIVWVVGHRIDERFRISEATRQVLILQATTR